jgi:lipopolysaccharide export system protein LptA
MISRRVILALGLALLAAPALAQDAGVDLRTPKAVDIEANEMEIIDADKRAIFRGTVIAKREDVTLTCQNLVVDYAAVKQPDGSDKTDVTNLDGTGNIKIVTKTQTITGANVKMDVKANTLTVTGDVKVLQGSTRLSGQKLFVNLTTNKSQMSGGRVKGSFIPNAPK